MGTKNSAGFLEWISIGIAVVLGLAMLLNGIAMMIDPFQWFFTVPGVAKTGPFNQHLVRDIGLIDIMIGGAFLAGAFRPAIRVAAWGLPALWLTGHAIFHFWEVMVGICVPSVLLSDFPAVTMPALIGLGLTLGAWRSRTA